jgi:hypothetical protein
LSAKIEPRVLGELKKNMGRPEHDSWAAFYMDIVKLFIGENPQGDSGM